MSKVFEFSVLSKSRKKGGVRSEGGDDKLEEPLLKDEDSVDMQNTAKESTSNRSSKRASRRKLVTSESVPKPPLMAGSKKDGNDDFCPGGSIYPNPKESSLFLSLGRQVDVYFPLRKRSRITAPFVFSGFEQTRAPLDVLPDECLFEILRRVPAGQERSACASVSKRWLTLLSSIKRDEFNKADKKTKDTITEKIPEVEDQDVEVDGYLARSLVGKKATDIRLAAIAIGTSSRGGLAKLSIHGSNSARRVTDLGLKAIACGCPSLRVLSLWGLSSIGDVGLSEIANGCPQLEKLDLSNCPAITDKSLLAFAKNCPLLSDVTIDSCSNIGNDGLQAVARCCPNLKSVAITNCPLVGDQGIAGMFSQATYTLKKVRLQKLNITDMSLAVVGHYGLAITNLVLSALPNVSEKGFWVMANGHGLQMLKSLTVASCLGVTDTGLEAIGRGCPNLQHLCVRHCTFLSDNGLVSFTKAAMSLESLQLEECHRITQFGLFGSLINCGAKLKAFSLVSCLAIRDLNLSFPLSSPCESMRSLSIRKCPGFGDASLAVIGKLCPKLQHIELCGLNGITDDGILPLLQSCDDGLLKINLSGCVNLTDKVVLTIGALHSWTIEMLNLDGCRNISDVSLVAIAKNCQRLSDLDISKCAITDYGIEALAFASQLNLQVLSVFGCSLISDESLESIGNLGQTLRGLNLQQCSGISSSSIDLLLEQLWRCDIVF